MSQAKLFATSRANASPIIYIISYLISHIIYIYHIYHIYIYHIYIYHLYIIYIYHIYIYIIYIYIYIIYIYIYIYIIYIYISYIYISYIYITYINTAMGQVATQPDHHHPCPLPRSFGAVPPWQPGRRGPPCWSSATPWSWRHQDGEGS